MNYEIITFGNGEILKSVFDAIAACLRSDSGTLYAPLIRLSLIIGGLWAALYAIYGDYMKAITHWIIPMTLIMQLLLVPQATVLIRDPLSQGPLALPLKVDHVPYGLAMAASYISKIGYLLTQQIEKLFVLPDDLKYQKTGTLFASHLILQSRTFKIMNEELAQNMRQFVGQCVFYDMLHGRKYTLETLRHSDDIWKLVSENASPVQSFLWRDLSVPGEARARAQIITCKEGALKLNTALSHEIDTVATFLGQKLFGKHREVKTQVHQNINFKQEFFRILPLAYKPLTDMAEDASEILKQNMMIYSVVDGLEQASTRAGNAPHFAVRRAYLQQRATYETLGAMAAETLPTVKAVLEAIAYSAFLFVIPLSILPFGWRFLSAWLQVLLWLQMWAPLYAILNYMMTISARSKSIAALSNSAGVTIANSVGLINVNADIAAMAGYLALSIPFLCIALVKGVGSFVHMASTLSQVSQGAGTQAAQDLVTGNYSFGNISSGNRQISNSNMLSQSYAASYRSGSFHQADGRTDVMTTSDGQQILNISNSNLPFSLNVAEMLSSQKSQQASKLYQKALSHSVAHARSMTDVLRKSVDLSDYYGKSTQFNQQTTDSKSIEQSKGLNKMAQIVKDFAKTNNLSTQRAAQVLASAGIGTPPIAKAFGIEAGFKTELSGNASKQDLYSEAEKTVQSKDFQEALRQTEQAMRNQSFGRTDEESKRLTKSINQALDKANSERTEATKSFRESEDYQQQASHIQSSTATINANYNQAFVEWLANQVADNSGGGRLGQRGAAYLIANNPQLTTLYAQRFLETQGLVPKKSPEMMQKSGAQLFKDYQVENGHKLFEMNEENSTQKMQDLKNTGQAQGLGPVHDHGLEEKVKAKEDAAEAEIANQQKTIEQKNQENEKQHQRESRKALMPQAVMQEGSHVWDLGTNASDLIKPEKSDKIEK